MAKNRGKQFEQLIREAFEKVSDTSVVRIPDQTNRFAGSANPCDFLIYHRPHLYAIECKSTHGNTLSIHSNDPKKKYGAISNFQWESLLSMSQVEGVHAGIICWWVDKDVTKFIPIQILQAVKDNGGKSIRYDFTLFGKDLCTEIKGRKKKVFFEYDMEQFFKEVTS